MNELSVEVFEQIVSHLSYSELCAIRLVCKGFSRLAAPALFPVLQFSAKPSYRDSGRSRIAEFGTLKDAIETVLPIAPHVKHFTFSPAWYRKDFWEDFEALREKNSVPIAQQIVHKESHGQSGTSNLDLAGSLERNEEAFWISAAKEAWSAMVKAQDDDDRDINCAVVKLLARMTQLEDINVRYPVQVPRFMAIDCILEENHARNHLSPMTWRFFSTLAAALHSNAQHIQTLDMYSLRTSDIVDTVEGKHVFGGLTNLTLSVTDEDRLLQDNIPPTPEANALNGLLKAAAPTLKYLDLAFRWPRHSTYDKTAPSLCPILKASSIGGHEQLTFPHLVDLKIEGFSVRTQYFTEFLARQSTLQTVSFTYVLLETLNTTWSDVARALPPSVQTWQVCSVSLRKRNHPDQCRVWRPFARPLPSVMGWRCDIVSDFQRFKLFKRLGNLPQEPQFEQYKKRYGYYSVTFVPIAKSLSLG